MVEFLFRRKKEEEECTHNVNGRRELAAFFSDCLFLQLLLLLPIFQPFRTGHL